MNSPEIEQAATFVCELANNGVDHNEMFRLCAEKFPAMLKRDFMLALQIAMHDLEAGA